MELLKAFQREPKLSLVREMIQDVNVLVRRTGCIAAARLRDPRLVSSLIICLRDSDFSVSMQSAYALVKRGKASVRPVMMLCDELLRMEKRSETEDWALFHCFNILRQLKAGEAVALCVIGLSDSVKRVRYAALGTLRDIEAREALPEILDILRNVDEPELLRVRAARIAAEWNAPEAVKDLIAAMQDKSEDVRLAGTGAFRKMKTAEAVAALIETVTDDSQKVSTEAVRALYFQTGEKLTTDFLRIEKERQEAQKKWRDWWQQNKDTFK
jgi:HEAT repeat protein